MAPTLTVVTDRMSGMEMRELMDRHGDIVGAIAKEFYAPGLDQDDLVQEGMIGLWKADRGYDPSAGASFRSFAALCVRRQIITAVKMAQRDKHRLLNEAAREERDLFGEYVPVVDSCPSKDGDPLQTLIQREEIRRISRALRVAMSPLQAEAVLGIANGVPYKRIGDGNAKRIDNAVQRARLALSPDGPVEPRAWPGGGPPRAEHACPGCGHETVKLVRGRGRPPFCNVCKVRRAA